MKKIKTFIVDHFEGSLIALILVGTLAIALLVHYKLSFLNFFFLPVILAGYFLGKKHGVLTSVFSVLVVFLYLIFTRQSTGMGLSFSMDDVITLVSWAGFLILTGALIGAISEQREKRLQKMRNAYIGILEVLFKYLECGDDIKPSSLRIASLAGKLAVAVGLDTMEMENIKSAALLSEAGALHTNVAFFVEMTDFLGADIKSSENSLDDHDKVILKSTASLLKEVEPLLNSFNLYYIQEAGILQKDLNEIPIGASILALAHIRDRISNNAPPFQGVEEYKSIIDIKKLSGRAFHASAVAAFILVNES